MNVYPLKFYEIYKEKIWGGRAIESVLSKRLPDGEIGESWEVSDHFDDVSVVRNGALEGMSLRELWRAEPGAILGDELAACGYEEFPLLVKFIDAQKWLSVQTHPDDAYAREHDPSGESGKNETWYVLHAEPGAKLIAGVADGTTKDEFKRLLDERSIEKCLHWVDVRAGDVVHIAAGTVHAVGPGILLAEIQETSDATYRVWDWGRVGADGEPRPLHIDRALDVIRFERGPVSTVRAETVSTRPFLHEVVDRSEFFVIEKFASAAPFEPPAIPDRFSIVVFIGGEGSIVSDGERYSYSLGDTVLVPAAASSLRVEPLSETTFLRTFVPRSG